MRMCKITFQPGARAVIVPEGTDLASAAVVAGVQLRSSCAGEGVCGQCRVTVREGAVVTEPSWLFTGEEHRAGVVLACRTTVRGDVQVEVPPEYRMEWEQILTDDLVTDFCCRPEEGAPGGDLGRQSLFTFSPLSTKLFCHLPPPTPSDNISDLERLYRELRRGRDFPSLQMELGAVRRLGLLLRERNWQVTVALAQRQGAAAVIQIEPGDTSRRNYGIALDLGTTTVVATLVELHGGKVLGTKATHNHQIAYGRDVISRLFCAEKAEGLDKLQRAAVATINELISALVGENGISFDELTALSCAGNTTMIHLLLHIDPFYLRRAPYVPVASVFPEIQPTTVGIKANARGVMVCLPGVSSYIGGDITAGVLASGIDEAEGPAMLIDLGTNGEIVLGNSEWLVCCSASAGTAFEGRGVRCGAGAVHDLDIDPQTYEVVCATVGEKAPIGICGSGYLAALAEFFRTGIIDRQGVIRAEILSPRIRQGTEGAEFVVVWAAESSTGRDISISQAEIDDLIRAKGAIYSAARVLTSKMGMGFAEVDRIYLGGGFGNYLNIGKAIMVGMLPDLPRDRFTLIGNSSLAGARMALLSREARVKSQEIARRMTNIELCEEPSYMGEYVGALFLPHTDADLFPSVMQNLERMSPCPAKSP